jgi:hypothetical protein
MWALMKALGTGADYPIIHVAGTGARVGRLQCASAERSWLPYRPVHRLT